MLKCLSCGAPFSDAFFGDLTKSVEFKGGRFACPQCGAEHVRRKIGELPSGAPLHSLRLWGHPVAKRRQSHPPEKGGTDRRKHPRHRSR